MNAGMSDRSATVTRETDETSVAVTVDIDGSGEGEIHTGIGFFDHMLASFATHGLFDITVDASGDLEVDDHHTVEDVGIVLGSAFDEALGNRDGIVRFADWRVPLDESVSSVVVDLSGRPLYRFTGTFSQEMVGEFTSQMARHFWRSFVTHAGITAHVEVTGSDAHHEIESLFKSFARALDDATQLDERRGGTPSTKGSLTE